MGDSGKRDGGQILHVVPYRVDGFFSSGLDDSSAAYALPMASFAYSVIGFPPNDLNSPYTAPHTGPYRHGWNDSVRSLWPVLRWYRHVMKNMSFCNFIGLTAIFSLKARRRMLLAISSGSIPVPGRLLLLLRTYPTHLPASIFNLPASAGLRQRFFTIWIILTHFDDFGERGSLYLTCITLHTLL